MERDALHRSIIEKSQVSFARSGGKGGQNVNKVNTKVFLLMPMENIDGIDEDERRRIREKLSSIINSTGCLYLSADDERSQELNRKIALCRLEDRIVQALKVPKKRKKTKPTKASKERKLKAKRIRSQIKKNRAKLALP